MKNAFVFMGLSLVLLGGSACSLKMLAVDTTAEIMVDGASAFEEEEDLELAEQAIAGNLKVLEALLKNSPDHKMLLVLLSKTYGGYAFAFMEDRYDEWKTKNPARAEHYKRKASSFYVRGKDFAMRYLEEVNPDFKSAMTADFEAFEKSLDHFDVDDVDALFWGAYNWGNWVNMNLHDPEAIAVAPRMERMMKKVLEMNETFFYGGPHLFYGVYFGGRSKMLGGDKEKAKEHFEKALQVSRRKFLILQVLYAQYYAVQSQEEALFQKLLKEVVEADQHILPEQNLITQLAKKKARRLLATRSEQF